MESANDLKAKSEFENAVIEKVVADAKVDIPQAMINKELDGMVQDLEMRLKYQGLDLETYYKFTNTTEEKFRDQMQEVAANKVKTDLVIGKIAQAENIAVSQEEINNKAKEIAAAYYGGEEMEKTAERLAQVQKDYLEVEIINEKVKGLILENSKSL